VTRWRAAAASGVLVALLSAPVAASGGVQIESVDTSDYPRISVTVALSAESLSRTPRADDFAVLVDGRRSPLDVFARAGDPLEVVVAIDTSGSMRGAAMTQARAAAVSFVEELPATVPVAVVSFATTAEVAAPFGTPRDDIVGALQALEAQGHTALYDGVVLSAGLFGEAEDVRRVVVLLSDGGDTSSEATLDEAAAALETAGVVLRAVSLITPDTDVAALEALSTGGPVLAVSDASDLAAAYQALALELTGRFRLSFSTSASGPTRVQVFVNTPDGVVTDSRVVPFPQSSVEAGAAPDPEPAPPPGAAGEEPAPAPATAAERPAVVPAPGVLGGGWALPVGVALVFVGVGAVFWWVGRNEDERDVVLPLDGFDVGDDQRAAGGWLASRLGSRFRLLTDRLSQGRMVRSGGLDLRLDRAGLALRPGEFVILAATGVIVAATAGLVLAGAVGAVLFGGAAAVAPRLVLRVLTTRRRDRFAEQLEGTLQIIAGSMRAGHALVQAISIVAAESESPTADEFNRVIVETRLGRTIEDSLRAMAQRMENEDLGWVVEAIEIQHKVGGNLVEVLDAVATTIRDRNQLRRQVKALSAEGRMSAIVLLALPFAIAGFIATLNPEYLAELFTSTVGRVMLGVAAVLMALGALWIRKLIEVEF
jgi:tight adherence protein B